MLPDLPKLRFDIAQVFQVYCQNRLNRYLGVVGEAPRNIIKEGRNPVIIRPDDSRDETTLKASSAETMFTREEIPNLSVEERMARLDAVAQDMAIQISKHAFTKIKDAVDKVGNAVDAKGKPLSVETLFEMLEKIQMDFDVDGIKHKEMTIVIPPAMNERMKEIMEQIHKDPELRKRHEEIIDKKRMEWRDREAARKLVG